MTVKLWIYVLHGQAKRVTLDQRTVDNWRKEIKALVNVVDVKIYELEVQL